MSYSIPDTYRVWANLRSEDRNKGFARLFPFYDNIRKHNQSLLVSNPNLNKHLEYCSYQHDEDQTPSDLQNLKSDVVDFFTQLYNEIKDEETKQNLFSHFVMRECNRKTIPISKTAIINSYREIFGGEIDDNTLTRVSNYCGLYYVEHSPTKFLIDTDDFSSIFVGDNSDYSDVEEESTDNSDTELLSFYNFLSANNFEEYLATKELYPILLSCAYTHFGKKAFTTDDLVSVLCADFGVEEDCWGMYQPNGNDYKKTVLRKQIGATLHDLRKNDYLKKCKPKSNKVTAKGVRLFKEYQSQYKRYPKLISAINIQINEDLCDNVFNLEQVIEEEYQSYGNQMFEIILCAHYELTIAQSKEHPVDIKFSYLCDYLCDQFGITDDIWGIYCNTKQGKTFRYKISDYKRRLVVGGHLAQTGNGYNTMITQKGIDLVENWIEKSEDKTADTIDFVDLMNAVGEIEDTESDETPTVDFTIHNLVSTTDDQEEDNFVVENINMEEETGDVITTLSVVEDTDDCGDTDESDDTDYDQYLRVTLAHNDELSEKVAEMKVTIDNLVSFLKDKDLLTEYIVSVTTNTEIPF